MKFRNILLLLLLILSFFPLFDLFHPGLPVTHDGVDHVARIANFYQNLQEGTIIPRWAGNLNWGYGHPILMFLYPLPSYMASLFHYIGLSFVDSTKFVFAIAFVISGLTMYLWIKSFLDEKSAFVAGVLYMFAPYRFVDLYVRGAIGEHVAFIFPPLILYFLHNLSKKVKWLYVLGGSLSLAGFVLAHNAITLMFLPIFFLYILYLFVYSKNRRIFAIASLFSGILGFALSSFFWLPAFFEGKYTLRDIVTKGEFSKRFVELKDFIYGPWSYGGTGEFTVQLGIMQWVGACVGILLITKLSYKDRKLFILLTGLVSILFFSLYLMTIHSEFIWRNFTTFQKFQFPWRFLSVSVFAASAIGGIYTYYIPKRLQYLLITLFTICVLWINKDYYQARDFIHKEESFYSSVYNGTTDTGESAPIWSVRFMLKQPKAPMEVIDGGAAVIHPISKTSTKHTYSVTTKEKVRLRENTLYFPGWFIYDNGREVSTEFQDPDNRGLMTFYVEEGEHDIIVSFKETKLRTLANIISTISIGIIFLGSIWYKIWRRFL